MNTKRWIALLCAAVLSFTSVACDSKAAETYSGQTLTGQVTAIDGSAVTIQLGELTEDTNTPPEMPDGAPNGQAPSDAPNGDNAQTPPDAPNGGGNSAPGNANGQPPAKPDGEDSGSTPPDMPSGDFRGNPGSSFTASEDTATLDFSSAAITKNGETVTLSDLTVGDIVTAAQGSGTAVTTAEIVTVGGQGNPGGGTVNVNGGSYTSNGYNSPAVYSTADITVKNAALTANNSEALVIEGRNSISLEDCTVTGNMSDTQGASSDENVHNVMICQSMRGDADVGTSTFTMTGGTLTAKNGDMFYVTNTHCILTLSGVTILNENADAYFLRVTGNSASRGWGSAGSNGAQVEFTADAQTLTGDIIVDTISTLTMTLKSGSSFTGTVNITDNAQGGTAVSDNAVVTVGNGCTWTLTGDCTLINLVNNGTINFNGYTITLADGTVLR